jgi:N-acetylglutamate synthase-like GNAT family acetyltransferase
MSSINFRTATEDDIPAIVGLLKISLGESLMPKSEEFWRWKHVQNPFGVSPVLLAEDEKNIIGVRAFMRWTWLSGNQTIAAVRAVDTATHPGYQGKGIFSSLTKKLLKQCEEDGTQIVFNTPNSKSLPGYLKMGWKEAGKLPINLRLLRPLNIGFHFIKGVSSTQPKEEKSDIGSYLNHPGLPALINAHRSFFRGQITSAHTAQSLQWRYEKVPVAKYHAAALESSAGLRALIIYRIKFTRAGKEFRLTDYFMESPNCLGLIKDLILEKCRNHHADFVTAAGLPGMEIFNNRILPSSFSVGPIVTVRTINLKELDNFEHFNQWKPSLGDLELF